MLQNRIQDPDLAHVYYRELKPFVTGMQNGVVLYREKTLHRIEKKLVNRWGKYIKSQGKELVYKKANYYGFNKRELWKEFRKTFMASLIAKFEINANRAFASAQRAIEQNLEKQSKEPGFFGLKALLRLQQKKLKMPGPIEGFQRMTSTGRIFHINLLNYILLLIRTGQAELHRRTEEIITFKVSHDLVWIDQHPCWLGPRADEVCNRWRNRIISLHGIIQGFPKMSEATSEKPPLFHPNCTHSYHALTDEEYIFANQNKILFYSQLTKARANQARG